MNVQVNYLAVVLAALSSMAVGGMWYAKSMLGPLWMRLAGVDAKKAKKGSAQAMVLAFVASLVTAYVLAHVIFLANDFFGNTYLQDALSTAFWLWLGLTAARLVTHDLFEQRPKGLTLMNIVHELLTLEVMALVIGLLKV